MRATGRTIKEDAARYRWLRDQAEKVGDGPMAFYTTPLGESRGVPLTGKKLDRAIDAILWDAIEATLAESERKRRGALSGSTSP